MLRRPMQRQSGASLVGIMIGIAIGLFLLAGGIKLYADYIQSNRQHMLAVRLNQELRAVTDLVARDLRRAGYWTNAMAGVATDTGAGAENVFTAIGIATNPTVLTFRYAVDADNTIPANETWIYRLQSGVIEISKDGGANWINLNNTYIYRLLGGVIQMSKDNGLTWGDLTDANATVVTEFNLTMNNRVISLAEYCQKTPPVGTQPPTMNIRIFDLTITGQAKADPTIRRQVQESVRVRSDQMSGACPA